MRLAPSGWSLEATSRVSGKALSDSLVWIAAVYGAVLVRYDLRPDLVPTDSVLRTAITAALLHLSIGVVAGLYRQRWRYGSFEEVAALAQTSAATAVVLSVLRILEGASSIPRSVPLMAGCMALLSTGGLRYTWRLISERSQRPDPDDDGTKRALVYGAGEVGAQIVKSMSRASTSPYVPVALIDDDPAKRRLSLGSVRVVGDGTVIAQRAREHRASVVLVAIAEVSRDFLLQLHDRLSELSPPPAVKVLPTIAQLLDHGPVGVNDLKDLSEEDLLGRRALSVDIDEIAGYLRGKRVLVTGAGGSIGSELARQIQLVGPQALVLVDRDESALHSIELDLHGRSLLTSDETVLCDIRDKEAIRHVMAAHRPQVVFHAAALKHLTLVERFPHEAVKSNVWGTWNVLEAAVEVGVQSFVNISTDKAADPSSVLGATKRIAERLTAHVAQTTGRRFLSVRFGNVLGSRGSVLVAFRTQIARGGPVTVTDKRVTRYFMTVAEAAQLVIQAGALGAPGEAMVLDMGEPVKIVDVARQLIQRSGREIPIVFTGLRPGEKLHEALFGHSEPDRRTRHPLISHVEVPPVDPSLLEPLELAALESPEKVADHLARLAST